ncbi:antibiotic biosynthesis monooxygenase [Halioxenophilus sp. WMMB6]|uniref:antibiotic biosynthesis monooxygenase n=1 Tax=Halioxenophilus sp. WMMB6 TaxID=3073815 RepID=UPI00295F3D35|nr:antibiotic biosynthesis monooxygenase [Halioxenophilus sp. WMMB6]
MKQLWLLAGGNGAGKSTFYRTQLQPRGLPFVNADLIAREFFPEAPEAHSYQAAQMAEEIRHQLLLDGRSFCYETVFSHPSKIDFVARAKAMGFETILVFVHLGQAMLNRARVAQRVLEGGHFVPDDKVENRLPRTLANIKQALPLFDQVWVLDNASALEPFKLTAKIINGAVTHRQHPAPAWLENLLAEPAKVILRGHIVVPEEDLAKVLAELPNHIHLTRQEPGCLQFNVEQNASRATVFQVYEEFIDRAAFDAHQSRSQQSNWGAASKNVERHYQITAEE